MTPDKTDFTPSGVWRADFEVILHWESPKWRLSIWKDILFLLLNKSAMDVKKKSPNKLGRLEILTIHKEVLNVCHFRQGAVIEKLRILALCQNVRIF